MIGARDRPVSDEEMQATGREVNRLLELWDRGERPDVGAMTSQEVAELALRTIRQQAQVTD